MTVKYLGKGGFILGQTAWEEFRPWLRPDATDYLAAYLPERARVFEWGAGAGTVWMARQGYSVVSCELDGDWVRAVETELDYQGLAARVRLIRFPPQASQEKRLRDYADLILAQSPGSFDLVLIDGRNRNRCLGNARPFVKPGGLLCLDNSERAEYAAGHALFDAWPGVEWGDDGWMTTVWKRPRGKTERVELETADA